MRRIAFAFDVVASYLLNIVDILIFGYLLHGTARVVVPLLSFGTIKVEDINADKSGFSWIGLKRLEDGRYLLNSDMSMVAGALFWLLFLVLYLTFTRGI